MHTTNQAGQWLSLIGALLCSIFLGTGCGGEGHENTNDGGQPGNADSASRCAGDAPNAARQAGICAGSVQICDANDQWVEPDYGAIARYESEETLCDGVDNDCDGQVDEAGCTPAECTRLTTAQRGLVTTTASAVTGLTPDALAYSMTGRTELRIDPSALGLSDLNDAISIAFWVKFSPNESQPIMQVRAGAIQSRFETAPERTDEIWYSMEAALGDGADGQVFESGAWSHIVLHFDRAQGIQTFTNGRPSLMYRIRRPVDPREIDDIIFSAQDTNATIALSDVQICAGPVTQVHIQNLVRSVVNENASLSTTRLGAALDQIEAHLNGSQTLSRSEQSALVVALSESMFHLNDSALAQRAADLCARFEDAQGAFFIAPNGDFTREDSGEFAWAMFRLQQGVLDYGFARADGRFPTTRFRTADYFPGPVGAEVPREMDVVVPIRATNLLPRAYHVHQDAKHRVQMTGLYVPPGETVTIRAPSNTVGRGIEVRVGIHDEQYDLWPTQQRFPRVLTRFALDTETIEVANPFGGALLFLVPVGLDLGRVEMTVSGAVAAPRFFRNDDVQTTVDAWRTNRQAAVPWAQLVGRNFMFSIPSSMIRTLEDPTAALVAWDSAMDGYMTMFGRPTERHRAEYFIADVRNPAGSFGPGYPTIMGGYAPDIDDAGWNPLNIVDPAMTSPSRSQLFIVLHEYGHHHFFPTLPGEVEVNVNLPATYVYHRQLGYTFDSVAPTPIDGAFMQSIHQQLTRDEAAVNWMITRNFANGMPMGIEEDHPERYDQLSYQSRGFAKYVDFAALLGWDALAGAYAPYVADDLATGGITLDIEPADFILNASRSAGVNTLPLFHFWGVMVPNDAQRSANAAYPNSPEILARLLEYRAQIPANQSEFDAHFVSIRDTVVDSWTEFYAARRLSYNETAAQRATRHLDCLIASYYPDAGVRCE